MYSRVGTIETLSAISNVCIVASFANARAERKVQFSRLSVSLLPSRIMGSLKFAIGDDDDGGKKKYSGIRKLKCDSYF